MQSQQSVLAWSAVGWVTREELLWVEQLGQQRIPSGNPIGSSSLYFSSPLVCLVGSANPLVGFTGIESLSKLLVA